MQPQPDLFDRAYELLIKSLDAQIVLRYLEVKGQLSGDLYEWMSAACWAGFDFDSQALAEQYRNALDPIDEYINPPTANEMKAN